VALAGVKGTVGGDTGDLLIGRSLVKQYGQHGRIAQVDGGELCRADFQRLLVFSDEELAPDAPVGTARLAGVPLPFALDLDPPRRFARTGGARRLDVDQKVQGTFRTPERDVDLQGLLAPRQRAEVGLCPDQADQPQ
jgi:hypothetical protein